jgi:hypothetical protein
MLFAYLFAATCCTFVWSLSCSLNTRALSRTHGLVSMYRPPTGFTKIGRSTETNPCSCQGSARRVVENKSFPALPVSSRDASYCWRYRVYKSPSYWSTRNWSICKHDTACDRSSARRVVPGQTYFSIPVAYHFGCKRESVCRPPDFWYPSMRAIGKYSLAASEDSYATNLLSYKNQ